MDRSECGPAALTEFDAQLFPGAWPCNQRDASTLQAAGMWAKFKRPSTGGLDWWLGFGFEALVLVEGKWEIRFTTKPPTQSYRKLLLVEGKWQTIAGTSNLSKTHTATGHFSPNFEGFEGRLSAPPKSPPGRASSAASEASCPGGLAEARRARVPLGHEA